MGSYIARTLMTLASSIVFFSFPDYTLKKKTPVHFLTGMDGD
jgi:hypothetical protein